MSGGVVSEIPFVSSEKRPPVERVFTATGGVEMIPRSWSTDG
jgi:hypothetical protein